MQERLPRVSTFAYTSTCSTLQNDTWQCFAGFVLRSCTFPLQKNNCYQHCVSLSLDWCTCMKQSRNQLSHRYCQSSKFYMLGLYMSHCNYYTSFKMKHIENFVCDSSVLSKEFAALYFLVRFILSYFLKSNFCRCHILAIEKVDLINAMFMWYENDYIKK